MNDKSNSLKAKISNVIKNESFYVVLFISICLIAIVTAVTISINKTNKKDVAKDNKPVISKSTENKATEKKDTNEVKKTETQYQISKSGKTLKEGEAAVIKASIPQLSKPVVGEILQPYSEVPVLAMESSETGSKTYKTNLGIDYKVKLGERVSSAAKGTVEYIGDNPKGYGYMVVVGHESGYKTVYANLDNTVSVSLNQKVESGQKLGIVGNTTLRSVKNVKDNMSFLHFSCLHGSGDFTQLDYENQYLDPLEFIK